MRTEMKKCSVEMKTKLEGTQKRKDLDKNVTRDTEEGIAKKTHKEIKGMTEKNARMTHRYLM
jgi:hypothetical protein